MRSILTIARLTILEAARRRLLLALGVLTLLIIAATGWGYTRLWTTRESGHPISALEVHALTSQVLILITFMFAGVLALSSVFVAAPSVSAEIESGQLLVVLARPISRMELLLGKWLGLLALVFIYSAGSGGLELLSTWLATGYLPPHPFQLIAYVGGEGTVLMTLALALSTRMAGMTGGIIALVGYFVAWVGGILAGIGIALHNGALTGVGTASKLLIPTDGLWRGAVWTMEPSAVLAGARSAGPLASADPFLVSSPAPAAFVAWAVVWVAGVVALAVFSLRRLEI